MQTTKFLHAALLVADLAKAEQFYGTVLELTKIDRPLNFPGTWYAVDGFQIHLMVASGVASELQDPEKWGRNRHLAFAVTDLAAMHDRLTAANYPVQRSASGRAALFVQDPDGNIIELSEATV